MSKLHDKPVLSIVLVNYKGWSWLEKCFESFSNLKGFDQKKGHGELEVILIDNGSHDGSVQKVEKQFPWVICRELETNLGFAGGNNVGIQMARGSFIMLLNTDTEFIFGTDLLALLNCFDDTSVAVVTPRVVLDTGALDHACHRGFPTLWNSLCYFSGLAKIFPSIPFFAGYTQSWKDLSTVHEVEACSGAAMIVRVSAMKEVGMLDESFFMYAEDIDWCYRFFQAGWKTIYDPRVTVTHHKHKSGLKSLGSWETKERTTMAFYDTMKQFFKKHYSHRYPSLVMLVIFWAIDTMRARKIAHERKQYDHSRTSI
jgi:GT2 family glycosyltransferase